MQIVNTEQPHPVVFCSLRVAAPQQLVAIIHIRFSHAEQPMNSGLLSRIAGRFKYTLAGHVPVAQIQSVLDYKFRRDRYFAFNEARLEYFFHSYNNWRVTERAIEIPVIRWYLEREGSGRVLEIGNVTNHYYEHFRDVFRNKTVIDKYETACDILNVDVADYLPDEKFDFVFSISTFEHMDSDLGRNPEYVGGRSVLPTVAADNLKRVADHLLKDGGKFVLTAPLGYTPEWDETFWSGAFDQCGFSRHASAIFARRSEITWEQIPISEAKSAAASRRWPGVNCVCVVEFEK